jgi:hypothetical protein
MGNPDKPSLTVACPHCHSILTVDSATGEVLLSKKAEKKEVESLDKAIEIEREKAGQKESLFEQAFEMEKKRKELLEKKFQEAQKSTAGDATPPPNPFDFD